jgi:hypothetical protein
MKLKLKNKLLNYNKNIDFFSSNNATSRFTVGNDLYFQVVSLFERNALSLSPFSNLETNDGTLITNGDAGLFA